MLIVLSPAKTLDYDTPPATDRHTLPGFVADAAELIDVLRELSPAQVAGLMHISDPLAALNTARFASWSTSFTTENAKQAILAFNGDVYEGLDAPTLNATQLDYVQSRLRILSGLYGLLRPLDLMQPYRLEMGTRLATDRGRSLYDWWGTTITDVLREDLAASPGAGVVVNLASGEYFGSVRTDALAAPVVSPRFEDTDARGKRGVVSFFAKRARGELAAWLVLNRVRTAGALKQFDGAGYRYDKAASTATVPVFVRALDARH